MTPEQELLDKIIWLHANAPKIKQSQAFRPVSHLLDVWVHPYFSRKETLVLDVFYCGELVLRADADGINETGSGIKQPEWKGHVFSLYQQRNKKTA